MRRFLWQSLPLREGEGPAGGTPPTPAPGAAPVAEGTPASPPPPAGDPPPAAEPPAPAGNGSLIPNGEPPAEGSEGVPEGEPPAAPPAPTIDPEKLTLPEGLSKDDTAVKSLTDILSDDKASPQERAQKLLDLYGGNVKTVVEGVQKSLADNYKRINDAWIAEVKADPVIGGAELDRALATVAKALDTYGNGAEVRKALALTGAGNNPHLIRLLHTMATKLSEGAPVQGSTPKGSKSATEILYGTPPSN